MNQLHEKPLPLGKTGNYTLTVDKGWLGGETITSVNVTCSGAAVTLPVADGNVLQAYFTAQTVGRMTVHWEWFTATRGDCYTTYIECINC